MKTIFRLLSLFCVMSFVLVPAETFALTWPGTLGVKDVEIQSLYSAGFEPSGLIFSKSSNTLFAVGDGGQVVEIQINKAGYPTTVWNVDGDLEGITIADIYSSVVWLLDENGRIIKYDLNAKQVLQTWDISAWVPEVGGTAGGEGIAYMSISGVNYFAIGSQYDGKITLFDLSGTSAVVKGSFMSPLGSDLSDMYFEDGLLYVIHDSKLALEVLSVSWVEGSFAVETKSNEYTLPAYNAEGFTLTPSNGPKRVSYLGFDSGGILSYAKFPNYSYVSGGSSAGDVPNEGVEIYKDGIDNNGNGLVDETNIGFTHPYYGNLNPSEPRYGRIANYWGNSLGDYGVKYSDNSIFRYSAFDIRTSTPAVIMPVLDTAYFVVVLKSSVALVNGYTGEKIATVEMSVVSEEAVKTWVEAQI
ncbi:MAG: hypothetical protein WC846_02385 [Candidatus Gracilibacteria bacterium]|jgi:hypothetical protein